MLTTRMEMNKKLEMMAKFGLRASNKSMEFKGSHEQLQMILGKKASKVYKMIVGGGITPIQASAVAIANI